MTYTKEEKQYLDMIKKAKEKHHIQTKLFCLQPMAVKFDLFNGHCELCTKILRSRPMYILKIPGTNILEIKYLCHYCAELHEKYIVCFIITKN